MSGSGILKNKGIVAGAMVLMMLAVMLFSAFYIAAETGHDCTGEACPICACIRQCESALHQISGGTSVQSTAVVLPLIMLIWTFPFVPGFSPETLVSRKVRLDS